MLTAQEIKKLIANTSVSDDAVFKEIKEYIETLVRNTPANKDFTKHPGLKKVLAFLCEKRRKLFNLINVEAIH
jgi:hypothetical protein